MFDALLGVIGLNSFQKPYPVSKCHSRKIHTSGKKDVLSNGSLPVFLALKGRALKDLGIQLQLSTIALSTKLTKMFFDLLQIQ